MFGECDEFTVVGLTKAQKVLALFGECDEFTVVGLTKAQKVLASSNTAVRDFTRDGRWRTYDVSVLKKTGGRCAQTGHPQKLPSPTKLARLGHFPPASQAGPVFYAYVFSLYSTTPSTIWYRIRHPCYLKLRGRMYPLCVRALLVRQRDFLLLCKNVHSFLIYLRQLCTAWNASCKDWTVSRYRMRFRRLVRVSDGQCQRRNSPRFNPSILRHRVILGAADEAGLKNSTDIRLNSTDSSHRWAVSLFLVYGTTLCVL